MKDTNSLSHTKWNCKYHIVFAPKYRRQVFFGSKKEEIGAILRELCDWKKVKIIEAEVCPDHIHMLVEILPKMSISSFMGFLCICQLKNGPQHQLKNGPFFSCF